MTAHEETRQQESEPSNPKTKKPEKVEAIQQSNHGSIISTQQFNTTTFDLQPPLMKQRVKTTHNIKTKEKPRQRSLSFLQSALPHLFLSPTLSQSLFSAVCRFASSSPFSVLNCWHLAMSSEEYSSDCDSATETEGSGDEDFDVRYRGGPSSSLRSELSKYLDYARLDRSMELDILAWWKMEQHRYPILFHMARDVLTIPISTVASESAFSIGGRVLDQYRSSLLPDIVQALLCTRDWIFGKKEVSVSVDDLTEYIFHMTLFDHHDASEE
ncbi:hypothetical protein ACLB2K_050289 [Fragaria x ananassa]